jgi:hypothetical protein
MKVPNRDEITLLGQPTYEMKKNKSNKQPIKNNNLVRVTIKMIEKAQ